ncbi:MAG: hypothetical protein OXH69_23575 [Acidobacteria bacterium]|nr:hypothetical protein [Acidobacteriota bacterium]
MTAIIVPFPAPSSRVMSFGEKTSTSTHSVISSRSSAATSAPAIETPIRAVSMSPP